MAIVIKNPSSLKIKFDHGLDENSKSIIRSKTFSGVKHDALVDDLYTVAEAIASLQEHDLSDVLKLDNSSLSK